MNRDPIHATRSSGPLILWLLCAGTALAGDAEPSGGGAVAGLRDRVASSPQLPLRPVSFLARPPDQGWESGMVSGVAIDGRGLIYEIQRGEKADPVLLLDREGKVHRSWGRGGYRIPHSIRIDSAGNVWTVDAGSSVIIEYSPRGEKLMTIEVGEQPVSNGAFSGATDIAFGRNGHLFITDGYGNARVLEYTRDGRRVKQWGRLGSGPGEFNLPHAIQIDDDGVIYVADRENGRIEKFDPDGRYLGEIGDLGRVYSLKLAGGTMWAEIQEPDKPPGPGGWLVKLDSKTGKMLGHLEVSGLHCVEQSASGEPVIVDGNGLTWFEPR